LIAAGFTPSFDRPSDSPLHQTDGCVLDTLRTAAVSADAVALERLERIRVLEEHVADLQYVLRLINEKS